MLRIYRAVLISRGVGTKGTKELTMGTKVGKPPGPPGQCYSNGGEQTPTCARYINLTQCRVKRHTSTRVPSIKPTSKQGGVKLQRGKGREGKQGGEGKQILLRPNTWNTKWLTIEAKKPSSLARWQNKTQPTLVKRLEIKDTQIYFKWKNIKMQQLRSFP